MTGTVAAGLFALSRIALPTPRPLRQTTFVYDAAGHQLAAFRVQNRVTVPLSAVPQVLIDAVVSTEDRHFFTEGALDPLGILRAFVADVRGSGSLQGGSTITQQYVKQTYLSPRRTLTRKLEEAALAIKLERKESKQQILQGYLNTIYWGRGAYGVEAASEAYFGKHVGQLDLADASLLAGLIREPETADPAHDPALARTNQTATLEAMRRDHKITPAQVAAVERIPFDRYVTPPSSSAGSAGSAAGDGYFVAAVRQQLVATYGAALVDGGGLRVTTTLDPTLEADAYRSVYGTGPHALRPAAGDPAGALVSIDDNGEVRALVGGPDYRSSTVDLALGAEGGGSGRQAGSTFKAIMLAEVIREGYSVSSTFPAPPEVVIPHGNANGSAWTVRNFEGEAGSTAMTLVDATAQSINTVYAQVVDRLGADKLDRMAEALGIKPAELAGAYPSQVLGTADVSPLEMAAAYATFADGGIYHAPLLITKVTTADGKPLPLPVTPTSRVVLTPAQAATEDAVLQQVVTSGTGTAARGVGSTVAGKTGTTEHSSDAWFIGFTPKLTTAVWMGYEANNAPMVDVRGYTSVQGGGLPALLWRDYMAAALAAEPVYAGSFPWGSLDAGRTLAPPDPGTLQFPEGLGTTTTTTTAPTTTTSTTTPATSVPVTTTAPTTTAPPTSTTTAPTTAPPTT